MADIHLRDTDWDLLDALWAADGATAREVATALQSKRGWTYSTVKTLLDRMVQRGLVTQQKNGRTWTYRAAVKRTEARLSIWKQFVSMAFQGAVDPALQFVATQSSLTEDQKQALLDALDEDEEAT